MQHRGIEEIYKKIDETEGIPGGRYSIILNDNRIYAESALGKLENTKEGC